MTLRRRPSTSSTISDSRSRFCSTRSSRRPASNFLALKTADPGSLFENSPAVSRRRGEQHVDLTLFDQAVGIGPGPGTAEQISNIAQPARLAVDQVFPFTAAVDTPGDVDPGRFDRQVFLVVIENQGGFGRIHRPPLAASRALEDHIGHFLAAQALGALLAQDPLDRVDRYSICRTRWGPRSR